MLEPEHLNELARDAGLDLVGVVPAGPSPAWQQYVSWVSQGFAGAMAYLSRPEAIHRRQDPRHIMPDARSVLVVGASYAGPPSPTLLELTGRVSRYAWRDDYHDWLLARVNILVESIQRSLPTPVSSLSYVDTGPVLERAWAQAAGLGWVGKNTNVIHPRLGSFLFLAVVLLDVALPGSPRTRLPTCGTCTRCLEACPTGALVRPGVLDARRCLSYLTIEHRGAIPTELRASVGTRVFGCDTCQDVCPWNSRPVANHQNDPVPETAALYLPDIITMDSASFRARFRRSAIWRATADGLARNAAVALGNFGLAAARPSLLKAATTHPSPLVREHASWALAQLS